MLYSASAERLDLTLVSPAAIVRGLTIEVDQGLAVKMIRSKSMMRWLLSTRFFHKKRQVAL
jgi:hypothetical protein